MSQKVLVPVDGSPESLHALEAAVGLANALGAGLVICSVTDVDQAATLGPEYVHGYLEALGEETAGIVKRAAAHVGGRVAEVESRVATGNVVEQIGQLASATGATWIVMGSHGRSGLSRFLMGSVAEGVLHRSSVPVTIVPPQRKSVKAA